MSCSVCFKCDRMVSAYEKYCSDCAKTHRQDVSFWREEPDAGELYRLPWLRERELSKDSLTKSLIDR